ncbi:hypothetical protein BB987_09240 [Photorhabdus temperata]|uniref:Uncharacterized protein n=1 Tax=Photorhabdus khanii NC19 TaxID=1004151 RepID=W3V7T4_9GAMM|nr:hypothetical protein [Photorhabdus khanii]ETS31084.1 hypothetical protein PTE_03036 [Photorhabdus khanii NC19]OHV54891.1 hypothetical protein BB987_09240 [Photorhabdus temperata]
MNDWILYFYAFAGIVATFVFGLVWLACAARVLCIYALWQLRQGKRALNAIRKIKKDMVKLNESTNITDSTSHQ